MFIVLLLFLFSVSAIYTGQNTLPNSSPDTIHHKTFKISAGKDLILNTESGDILITPWEKDEVDIKVLGNERAKERMKFDFAANNNEVKVTAKKQGGGWNLFSNLELKYEIKVPASFNIEVSTAGGDIQVGGVKGKMNLNTSGGDIWADRCTGSVNLKTSGGDINVYTSDTPVNAHTSGGDISLEYSGINKGIELKTSGGDIVIKVSPDIKANVELSTSGGDVSNSGIKISNATKMSSTKIIGEINGGGEKLIAKTSGGDVELIGLD
jgi:DUF4097 and DUF4098 domain-containing protein YvlB